MGRVPNNVIQSWNRHSDDQDMELHEATLATKRSAVQYFCDRFNIFEIFMQILLTSHRPYLSSLLYLVNQPH